MTNLKAIIGNRKRILVTGGAGFIGSAVIRKILKDTECIVFNLDKIGYASDLDSIEETEKANQENSERIKNLINKLATDNVGNKLADYQPMEHPNIQPTKQVSDTSHLTMDPEDLLPQTLKPEPNNFGSNDISLGNLSNYNDTYNQSVSNTFEAVPIHRSIYS